MRIGTPDLTINIQDFSPEMGMRNVINCAHLSSAEHAWLLDHLDEPPAKALAGWDRSVPHSPNDPNASVNDWCEAHPGVVPANMDMILSAIRDAKDVSPQSFGYYKRDDMAAKLLGKLPNEEFHGIKAFRTALEDSQQYHTKFQSLKDNDPGSALHPSKYTKDARGRLHWQGPGSDSGAIQLFMVYTNTESFGAGQPDEQWAAAVRSDSATVITPEDEAGVKTSGKGANFELIEGDNFIECPVIGCNKRIDYDADDEGARRKGISNMHKHMKMTSKQVDDHREAGIVIFG